MQSRQLRRAAERQAIKEQQHQAKVNAAGHLVASRAETNRANSQHSTGPRTTEGKAASSQNSFKHGAYSKSVCAPDEDPAELDALKADLRAEHQPVNTTEEILVNEMAEQFWRIRRFRQQETVLVSAPETGEEVAVAIRSFMPVIQRAMAAAERGLHKAIASLRQLQKDRGFVPHFSENTKNTPKSAVSKSDDEMDLEELPYENPYNSPKIAKMHAEYLEARAENDRLDRLHKLGRYADPA